MWCSATTPTTGGVTPPTSPTTSPSRRRSARRTSGRAVSSSTNRSHSTRQLMSAGLLWSRIVMSKVLKFAGLSTSPSVGPSRRSMIEDDVVECTTEVEEKCEDETSGYTTNTKCSKWPKEVCSVSKKNVKKYTPITGCTKEPRELC